MDIKAELTREHTRSKSLQIADYVGFNPIRFKSLIKVYFSGPYRITQRAAWPLSMCVQRHPSLIKPHLTTLLDFMLKPNLHDAVKRNTMRLLQYVEIPKRLHAKVINICFEFLLAKKIPTAIKAFSMSVLSDLIKDKPELIKELKIIIEDQLPYASPGFVSRARKTLKQLK